MLFPRLCAQAARVVAGLAAATLAALVAVVGAETVAWALLARSIPQAEEVQALLLVWLGFLSAALGVREGLHLRVEVVDRLPGPARRAAARVAGLAVVVFGLLVARYGAELVAVVENTLPATGLPAAAGYAPGAVGGALIALFAVERLTGGSAGRPAGRPPGGSPLGSPGGSLHGSPGGGGASAAPAAGRADGGGERR